MLACCLNNLAKTSLLGNSSVNKNYPDPDLCKKNQYQDPKQIFLQKRLETIVFVRLIADSIIGHL